MPFEFTKDEKWWQRRIRFVSWQERIKQQQLDQQMEADMFYAEIKNRWELQSQALQSQALLWEQEQRAQKQAQQRDQSAVGAAVVHSAWLLAGMVCAAL